MQSSPRITSTPYESAEGAGSLRTPTTDLSPPGRLRTIRECDTEIQELKRENFNLKLRIYFLEQNGAHDPSALLNIDRLTDSQDKTPRHPHARSPDYYQQNIRSSSSQQPQTSNTVLQSYPDGQLENLIAELKRYREENENLREQILELKTSATQSLTSSTNTIVPGDKEQPMPVSTFHLQFNENEQKLRDENNSLKDELQSLRTKLNKISNDFELTKEQHKKDVQLYDEQRLKADHVLRRLIADYDARIATIEKEHKNKIAEYESYQHEPLLARIRFTYPLPEQTNSNADVNKYLEKIEEQEHIITQCRRKINELESNPPSAILTSTIIDSEFSPENLKYLNQQLRFYKDIIERLGLECYKLQQKETNLRQEINQLNTALKISPTHPGVRRNVFETQYDEQQTTFISQQTSSMADHDSKKVDDLQLTIIRISTQLADDAENVSNLNYRIKQLIKDYNESQNLIRERDERIQKLQAFINDIENQANKKYSLEIDRIEKEKTRLQEEIDNYDRRLASLREENDDLRAKIQLSLDTDNVERENLVKQVRIADERVQAVEERIVELQNELIEAQRVYDSEQEKKEKMIRALETRNSSLENDNQQQKEEIANLKIQIKNLDERLDEERAQFEREINSQKNEYLQKQIEHENAKRQLKDLQYDCEQSDKFMKNQEQNYKQQIFNLETQIGDLRAELNQLNQRLYEALDINERRENEYQQCLIDIENSNVQMNNYHQSLNEYENEKKDYQNQLNMLKTEYEALKEKCHMLEDDIQKWKHKSNETEKQLHQAQIIVNQLEQENSTFQNELQECEQDLELLNQKKQHVETKCRTLERELEETNSTVKNYENEIQRLQQELNASKESYLNIENAFSGSNAQQITHIKQLEDNILLYVEQIRQLNTTLVDREDKIEILQQTIENIEQKPSDIDLRIRIQIQEIEKELEIKEQTIQEIRANLQETERKANTTINRYKDEIKIRDNRIDSINQQHIQIIHEYERNITTLRDNIAHRDNDIIHLRDKLSSASDKIQQQQAEITRLIAAGTLTLSAFPDSQEKEQLFKKIQELERQVEMQRTQSLRGTDKREQYQNIIDDLKRKLQEREETKQERKQNVHSNKSLQHSLDLCNEQLNTTRQTLNQVESDCSRRIQHFESMESELKADIENRDRKIATLRQDLSNSEQQIIRLKELNLTKDKQIKELKEQPTDLTSNSGSSYVGHTPADDKILDELQKKNDEVSRLKQELEQAKQEIFNLKNATVTSTLYISRPRPNLDKLSLDELKFELDMAFQQIEDLNHQLKGKFPNITELHNQVVEVRNELARQKYVNQVLWRKLNALIDIHGSNTRAELAIELANYQDELAKLKQQHTRMSDTRSTVVNANSRSSSEQNLSLLNNQRLLPSGKEFPSKNIKSTVSLLEHINIEWQTRLARLTEQLGRSESQSRNYYRELSKYQKLLYEAGLTKSFTRQRRYSADDSFICGLYRSNKTNDDLNDIENLDELKNMIRNQRKYIDQLQKCVRLNTPNNISFETREKFQEQIRNLNSVIDTYRTESTILRNELHKFYQVFEQNKTKIQQYEKHSKDQYIYGEQLKYKLLKYEEIFQKYGIHLTDKRGRFINSEDQCIIDLDIDIIEGNVKKKKASAVGKPDSGIASITESHEYRSLKNEKEEQIQKIASQLDKMRTIADERDHMCQNLTELLEKHRNDSKEAYNRITQLQTIIEQLEKENQRLKAIIEKQEVLIQEYKNKSFDGSNSPHPNTSQNREPIISTNESSQLLAEMSHLRRDIERSIEKEAQLQSVLDESLRESRKPREFTFSGRGVSYPDLRLVGTPGLVTAESMTMSPVANENLLRPSGLSLQDLHHSEYTLHQPQSETIQKTPFKSYMISEVKTYDELRELLKNIKLEFKQVQVEIKERVQSIGSSNTNTLNRFIDNCFNLLDQRILCAIRFTDTFWKADLPEKNRYEEHRFIDYSLIEENKRLLSVQRKYIQDIQTLKQKHKEQAMYIDQLLTQLTKSNRKKADTGEYLALLLRPTLDVLQKARTNIEHHLQDSNTNTIPPGSAQTYNNNNHHHHHRRRRTNRHD